MRGAERAAVRSSKLRCRLPGDFLDPLRRWNVGPAPGMGAPRRTGPYRVAPEEINSTRVPSTVDAAEPGGLLVCRGSISARPTRCDYRGRAVAHHARNQDFLHPE